MTNQLDYPRTAEYICYQCNKPVKYLFADGRGSCCTRLTREEIEGDTHDEE